MAPDRRNTGAGNSILIWATCPDDRDVLAAIEHVRHYEHAKNIILVVAKHRAAVFDGKVDEILTVGGFRAKTMTRLGRRIWGRAVDLNVIACGNDFNHYQTVRDTLNYAFAIKRQALVAVHLHGQLLKFPIEIQQRRRWAVPALAAFGVLGVIAPLLALGLVAAAVIAVTADILYRIYMDRMHHVYYWVHLSFQREEMPYVMHGWMRPFGESYYNRMVTAREGPMRSGYDINGDCFPVCDPLRAANDLPSLFHFVNTHDKPLDDVSRTVFVLGGSVAQGLIDDPATYSARLEQRLQQAGHDGQVVPWAIGGFVSTQSRLLVEMSLVERRPFAVVSLDFYNDCHYTIMGVAPGDTHRSQRKLVAELSMSYRLLSPWFRHSALARQWWQNIYSGMVSRHMASLMASPEKLEIAVRKCVALYLRNVRRIHALCGHEGIRHCAFIQPFRDDLRSDGDPSSIEANQKARLMNRCYQELARQLAEQPDMRDIVVAEPVFPVEHYCDEVHFTPSGQDEMAAHMARTILPWFATVQAGQSGSKTPRQSSTNIGS